MGNQNTSGIIEEEKAAIKAPDKSQVSSPRDQEEEEVEKIVIGKEETIDFKEKAAESDSQDLESAEKEKAKPEAEEHKGSDNEDSETQTTALSSVEPKESKPDDEISQFQNKVHDQPSFTGEMQTRSTVADSSSQPIEVDHVDDAENENEDVADDIVSETDASFNPLNPVDISVAKPECSAFENEDQELMTNELGTEMFDPLDEVKANDEKALDTNPGGEIVFVQTEVSNIPARDQDNDENDECIPQSQSSLEIEQGADIEKNTDDEKLDIGSVLSCKGGQVELKKSTSFDFGLPFDARPGESDQTPLLYNGTAARSFSSSSTMRFQNTGVQTEHYEAVKVEEKTIRMERSNSENLSRANLSLNLQNKKENVHFITNGKQEICDFGEGQENGFMESSCDVISPKENGKRKPRSTFFTTCICCTAAIS